ncbi:MAG: DUF465 domain-containing protein [Sinobacterium sp.]|nr:DUF465 domain-containing protein [Sinobacterium sp.]
MNITHLDLEEKREALKGLRIEHRNLDNSITELAHQRTADQFEMRRLKRRKLNLKDTILKLESLLIPDLNA